MLQTDVRDEIVSHLDKFTVEQQQKVLQIVRSMASDVPVGVPGNRLLHYAGTLSKEEAEEMMRVIEEECERIDLSAW
ncbi:MAG: hypothetical protein QOH93_2035 [Chloroflexia bacterium]|jgi:hypothetical protein|nr:hypothetical protein [Chloroflexia bacterium]